MTLIEVLGIIVLFVLMAGVLALLAGPVLLILALAGVFFKLSFLVLIAPIRLFGWFLGMGVTLFGLLLKGFVLTGAAALLILVGLLPLVPLVMFSVLIYFLVRPSRYRAAPTLRS